MKYIKTAILIAGMAAATAACNAEARRSPIRHADDRHPASARPHNGCKIEYRFATIGNAGEIGRPGAPSKPRTSGYFFELEEFGGTARQAADSALLPGRRGASHCPQSDRRRCTERLRNLGRKPKAAVHGLARHLHRSRRWSFTGGAHGMYGIGVPYLFAGTDGYELSHGGPVLRPGNCSAWRPCCARKLCAQYGAGQRRRAGRTGLFPGIHRPDGEFPDHSRRDHLLLQPLRHRMLCTREPSK